MAAPEPQGPHLLQHVLSEVLLLVHPQDGLPDLLVGKLQPTAKPHLEQPGLAPLPRSDPRPPPSEARAGAFSLSFTFDSTPCLVKPSRLNSHASLYNSSLRYFSP